MDLDAGDDFSSMSAEILQYRNRLVIWKCHFITGFKDGDHIGNLISVTKDKLQMWESGEAIQFLADLTTVGFSSAQLRVLWI